MLTLVEIPFFLVFSLTSHHTSSAHIEHLSRLIICHKILSRRGRDRTWTEQDSKNYEGYGTESQYTRLTITYPTLYQAIYIILIPDTCIVSPVKAYRLKNGISPATSSYEVAEFSQWIYDTPPIRTGYFN